MIRRKSLFSSVLLTVVAMFAAMPTPNAEGACRPFQQLAARQPVRSVLSNVFQAQPVRRVLKAVCPLNHLASTCAPASTCASVAHTPAAEVLPAPQAGGGVQVLTGSGRALQSAMYRAQKGIKGHTAFDSNGGVGWATHNPMPVTCLGAGGSNYAVVKSASGYYATKLR